MDAKAQLVDWLVPAPPTGSVQAGTARFSEGDEHSRRRAIAESRLAMLDPAELRGAARRCTAAKIAGRKEVEIMSELARTVPVAVLAAALGSADPDAAVAATRRLCLALAPPEGSSPSCGWPEVRELAGLLGLDHDVDTDEAVNVVALSFRPWTPPPGSSATPSGLPPGRRP